MLVVVDLHDNRTPAQNLCEPIETTTGSAAFYRISLINFCEWCESLWVRVRVCVCLWLCWQLCVTSLIKFTRRGGGVIDDIENLIQSFNLKKIFVSLSKFFQKVLDARSSKVAMDDIEKLIELANCRQTCGCCCSFHHCSWFLKGICKAFKSWNAFISSICTSSSV